MSNPPRRQAEVWSDLEHIAERQQHLINELEQVRDQRAALIAEARRLPAGERPTWRKLAALFNMTELGLQRSVKP